MTNNVVTSPVDMKERADLGIKAGDTVRVWQKIEEKGKTRLQAFEGLVLACKHGSEAGGTFTVRKVSSGVGVEKIFPLYSPNIDKIEIVKRAKVRRAKLYFIRDKVARDLKRVLRRTVMMGVATKGSAELEEERKKAEEEEAQRQAEENKRAEEKDQNEEVVEEEASQEAVEEKGEEQVEETKEEEKKEKDKPADEETETEEKKEG
ncbi:50S ribosomal protein L19 [bacterium]|nr:50S ribosomal protein L19 [bacterium]|tara:strand:+ start:3733 stop:4350 length:618 start_codon:yes stop_codon:yes gene_type:complete